MDPVKLFISYSHKDEALRDELVKHLTLLEQRGVIKAWHDRNIDAGDEWADEIDENLNQAQVILLLISADFLASRYCRDIEMKRAMERHEAGEAIVIPVILRDVDWQDAPFGTLQALPTGGEPVENWPSRDKAFADIARGIRKRVEKLTGKSFESTIKDKADAHEPEPIQPKPSRRLRRKGIVIVAVLTAVILASVILVPKIRPRLDPPRKVNRLDDSPWIPSHVGWKIQSIPVPESEDSPIREKTGHLIKGEQIGLLGKSGLNPYSLYQDFKLDLNVSLVNDKGVAWVVRAKDFNNFCLFELYPPNGAANAGKFVYSFYKNGKRKQAETSALPLSVGRDLSSMNIRTEVKTDSSSLLVRYFGIFFRGKSRFKVEANTFMTPEYKMLCEFEDENGNAAPYGGVGFYPRNGMEFLLLDLGVERLPSQTPNR